MRHNWHFYDTNKWQLTFLFWCRHSNKEWRSYNRLMGPNIQESGLHTGHLVKSMLVFATNYIFAIYIKIILDFYYKNQLKMSNNTPVMMRVISLWHKTLSHFTLNDMFTWLSTCIYKISLFAFLVSTLTTRKQFSILHYTWKWKYNATNISSLKYLSGVNLPGLTSS